MQITLKTLQGIYSQYDVELSERDAHAMLQQCNEQDGINGRSAADWADFFACQDMHEQQANDAEMSEFHRNAYGE